MDTVDARGMEEWEQNLKAALDGRKLDFLVISHLEPDHAGSIGRLLELYPDVVFVGNAKRSICCRSFLIFSWMTVPSL